MKKMVSTSFVLASVLLAQDITQKQVNNSENTPPPPLAKL